MIEKPSSDDRSSLVKGALLGITCSFIWAGWVLVTSMGAKFYALSKYDIAALRFTTSGILFLPYLLKKGIRIGPRGWIGISLMTLCAGPGYIILAATGMSCTSVCHVGGLLPGTIPLFTGILSVLFLKEKVTSTRLVGLLITVVGAFALTGFNPFGLSHAFLINYASLLLASFSWGVFTVAMRYWKVSALHAAAIVSVFSMVIYDTLYLLFSDFGIARAPFSEIATQSFYQGVMAGVIALTCYGKTIEILGASRGAIFVALVPILVALMGIPLMGEWPQWTDWGAIFILTFGVFLAIGVKFKKKS